MNLKDDLLGSLSSLNEIQDRCDYDVLLREERRHREILRDGYQAASVSAIEQVISCNALVHAAGIPEKSRSLRISAIVLASLHAALDAHGHGNETVIAFANAEGKEGFGKADIYPSRVNHERVASLDCDDLINECLGEIGLPEHAFHPIASVRKGIFDAILVWMKSHDQLLDIPKFPLAVLANLEENTGSLRIQIRYASDLLDQRAMLGLIDVLCSFIERFLEGANRKLSEISLVTESQKHQLAIWNDTDGDFPRNDRLEDLFEQAVARTPEREAIVFGSESYTYDQLNSKCNAFASLLKNSGFAIEKDEIIGLYLDKSELCIIAAFGIWKAGAAYMPIDPSYPSDRVNVVVRDSGIRKIIANRKYVPKIQQFPFAADLSLEVFELESMIESSSSSTEVPDPKSAPGTYTPGGLAYVMFTSGTTGTPKGVAKKHRSVVNSITDLSERYGITANPGTERIGLFSSFVFEPFMRQTLLALINNHTLIVVPDEIRLDPHAFPLFVKKHGITYLNGTRSVLQHFDLRDCYSLTTLALVGEELTASGLRQLRDIFGGRIINEYAFTESAFVTAVKEFAPGVAIRNNRSIGRPLRNIKWYIANERMMLLPIGAIGELYIGGEGVADGYINRPELSAERFLVNPFQTDREKVLGVNATIYKTGDLARMLPDGEVEYMGRADFQIKINGVRIEPGEIEAKVAAFPGVKKCLVVPRESSSVSSERCLVGYYTTETNQEILEEELLRFLEDRLIRVMVPSRMIHLDSFPLNVNGKVDWRALPAPVDNSLSANSRVQATEGESAIYHAVREILAAILGLKPSDLVAESDFFRLGGHSVSCVLFIARVRKQLRRSISVTEVFKLRTLREISELLSRDDARIENAVFHSTTIENDTQIAANGLQQGMLYHALLHPSDDAYIMQTIYQYDCTLDPQKVHLAWKILQRKHPALRLRFNWDRAPMQLFPSKYMELDWNYIDLSDRVESVEQDACIEEMQTLDRQKTFSLSTGPMLRVYLFKLGDQRFKLLFSCHHTVLDGWSMQLLWVDFHSLYSDLLYGRDINEEVDNTYLDAQRFWEAHRLDNVDYWSKRFAAVKDRIDLQGLLNEASRYKVDLRNYDCIKSHQTRKLSLPADQYASLRELCAINRVTLHSVLQFAWHKVLQAIGGGVSTVVGTVVSVRDIPIDNIENAIGLLINTLPLIVDHEALMRLSIAEAIQSIQEDVTEMQCRSIVDFGSIEHADTKRSLFDSLFVLENYSDATSGVASIEKQQSLPFMKRAEFDKVDYPLAIVAREEDDQLAINLWYAGELFSEHSIGVVFETLQILLDQIITKFTQPVRDLEFVSTDALAVFDDWNDSAKEIPASTLNRIFEDSVERFPNEIALVFADVSLTYEKLNARANRLADYLLSDLELGADDLVALVMDKSEEVIISILAIWKAGAAFLPISADILDDRLRFVLDDSKPRLILTNRDHLSRVDRLLPNGSCRLVAIETLDLANHSPSNPRRQVKATDLAYAIYTSGTTGNPKAVLVEHSGVVNLQYSLSGLFQLDRSYGREVFCTFSNFVFDHFVEVLTDALLNGQTLVLLPEELRGDPEKLYAYMRASGVTYLSGTPTVLAMYEFEKVGSITRIDAIGEDFTQPLFDKLQRNFDGEIINGYGPTEISITSHKRIYRPKEPRLNKSIGFPVANTRCYVVNEELKRVPIGAVGELLIGGAGVTRGYLRRESLTSEKFIQNLFEVKADSETVNVSRLYRTGDLVRWLPNGELEFLGRRDFQVKINGQRVELGEIESVLSSHPDIQRSIVVFQEKAFGTTEIRKFLVAYYQSEGELHESELKKWLRGKLPESFVPKRLQRISSIPLTTNGKLDFRALPPLEPTIDSDGEYFPPRSDMQLQLCSLWSKVLSIPVPVIAVQDDFFAVGGDSLKAIQLAGLITRSFGRKMGVKAIFDYRTIETQEQYLKDDNLAPIDGAAIGLEASWGGDPPISLAQERLVFIDEFMDGTNAFNIPFVLKFAVSDIVSEERIKLALRTLVTQHPTLRTLLRRNAEGDWIQEVLDNALVVSGFQCQTHEVASEIELNKRLLQDASYVFRLGQDWPFRASIFKVKEKPDTLFLSCVGHHTCMDGWSLSLLVSNLVEVLCNPFAFEPSSQAVTYADFAIWQRNRMEGELLEPLKDYWLSNLAASQQLSLPLDKSRPLQFDYRGREVFFEFDEHVSDAIYQVAKNAKTSTYSVLLSAFCLMLKQFTGQSDILIGAPTANRIHPEFHRVVGFFANLIALRVKIDVDMSLQNYIRRVSETVIQAQIHQEFPFEKVVQLLNIQQDTSRHPLFQCIFALLDEASVGIPSDETNGIFLEKYTPYIDGTTTAKFDLSFTITQTKSGLSGNVTYADSLFHKETIGQFIRIYQQYVSALAEIDIQAATPSVLDILSMKHESGESTDEMTSVSHSTLIADRNRSLDGIFEDLARAHPDWVAVKYGDRSTTYKEIDRISNAIAGKIAEFASIQPNELVALVMDKSELMIAAIIAVWKSGAAYLPIDPTCPEERTKFILKDAGVKLIIADSVNTTNIRILAQDIVVLDVEQLGSEKTEVQSSSVEKNDSRLAYAIYTSGTTGEPKAVLVSHANVISFRDDIVHRYGFANSETPEGVLFLANYTFDFSIEQFLLSFLSGHTLIIPPPLLFADERFYEYVNASGLTYLSGTPSQVMQIDLSRIAKLRTVLVAGEHFAQHHFDKIRTEFPGRILNAYGTTETTVYNTVKFFDSSEAYCNDLGQPLSNTRLYLLGREGQLLPSGAQAELCIAGDCVSCGYLNRPSLTDDRFIKNQHQTDDEKNAGLFPILYRTGDLVRRRVDGGLEYIGRYDTQVKLNGVRVELSEVESVLLAFEGIQQCAVIAASESTSSDGMQLTGYYIAAPETVIRVEDLFRFLRKRLIPAMVPATLHRIEGAFPITSNGKLDTKSLPKFVASQSLSYSFPRSRLESRLCQAWEKILGIEAGIDGDFFRCGGDSIGAMQLASELQRVMQKKISVKSVFDFPTVREFARNESHCDTDENASFVSDELAGDCPLLPIQKWFFNKQLSSPNHWHQYFAIRVPELNLERLQNAVEGLASFHDAFALKFSGLEGSPTDSIVQFYNQVSTPKVEFINVTGLAKTEVESQLFKMLEKTNLEKGPLCFVAYLSGYDDGSSRVWIAMHHLIVDAVSWRIITQDLAILYHGGQLGRRNVTYRDWTVACNEYKLSSEETEFWEATRNGLRSFSEAAIAPEIPLVSHRLEFALSVEDTRSLLANCNRRYDTVVTDLLLVAIGYALRQLTDRNVNYVSVESHGREVIDGVQDVRDTVGWFTTMHPLVVETNDDLESSIRSLKETRSNISLNGLGYGIAFGYDEEQCPLPWVTFNYLGQFHGSTSDRKHNSELWSIDPSMFGISKSSLDPAIGRSLLDLSIHCAEGAMIFSIDSCLSEMKTREFAAETFERLKEIIKHTLAGSHESRRIRHLAESSLEFEPYIRIDCGASSILFVLPPGDGGAESYLNNLAKKITDVNLVLFNNVQLHSPMSSIENLASYYLRQIRDLQPEGPYHLCGWSFGGVLSLEIALQLVQSGQEVANLIFIDSFFNASKAIVDIGLEEHEDAIDALHTSYFPNPSVLDLLATSDAKILLFHATKVDLDHPNTSRRLLFEYYSRSRDNNLSTLIHPSKFAVRSLDEESHFSWILREACVDRVSQIVSSLLK